MVYETKLTKQQLTERARKAGKARWLPKATHEGVINILGKKLPCVVLEDSRRLISEKSIFHAFNRQSRGSRSDLPSFIDAKNLIPFTTEEIMSSIKRIPYLNNNKAECSGYSAETIPIVCEIYLSAKKSNKLTLAQLKLADVAEQLLKSLSRVGIIGLIDEATGYQLTRPRDALEAYLNKFLSKELASWCKRFPDEFYENIYKLKRWPEFSTSKNKYSVVGHYTNDIVYSRIGKDVLEELKSRVPDTSKESMHQWLSVDTGHPILSQHIHSVIGLQRLALLQGHTWKKFIEMMDGVYPVRKNALESQKLSIYEKS